MTAALLALLVVLSPAASQDPQETHPKVPKDSVLVTVTGCVTGRVIRASDVRQDDTQSGPVVRGRAFRLAGKKDVMEEVKKGNGQEVQITGLIKKSALSEPGVKFKGGRIAIGGGTMSPGSTSALPDPADNVVVLDISSVQAIGGSCHAQ